MKTHVEISIAGYDEHNVLLQANHFQTGDIIATNLTCDELFACEELRPVNVIYPISVPDVSIPGLREQFAALSALSKEIDALEDERVSTTNTERYKSLTSAHGPIRSAKRQLAVRRLIVAFMLEAATGVSPRRYRDLGIS
ncbi:hypothetical protein ACFONL_01475 [Camelimonas fluminis]|uniref:Uncharacterized protein n=1 Tax=Camelimonas fluminis TaxID=1576911 RepID=A0ABV7UBM9_9HYPH|nr:hypothetical protein [Camelimonas fluminis]